MKSKKAQKLHLTRESLRLLEPAQLEAAGGIQTQLCPLSYPRTACIFVCHTGELC